MVVDGCDRPRLFDLDRQAGDLSGDPLLTEAVGAASTSSKVMITRESSGSNTPPVRREVTFEGLVEVAKGCYRA